MSKMKPVGRFAGSASLPGNANGTRYEFRDGVDGCAALCVDDSHQATADGFIVAHVSQRSGEVSKVLLRVDADGNVYGRDGRRLLVDGDRLVMDSTITTKLSRAQFQGQPNGNADADLLMGVGVGEWGYVTAKADAPNLFITESDGNGVITFNTGAGENGHQLGLAGDGRVMHRHCVGGMWSHWEEMVTAHRVAELEARIASLEAKAPQ